MTSGADGWIRASDADRSKVQSVLADAYGEGRLDWAEMDARSTALANAVTYADLERLTADLPGRIELRPAAPQPVPGMPPGPAPPGTNSLAVAALCCGLGQFLAGFPAGIAAIICGHKARRQIRLTGQQGGGMATAGLILGYAGVSVILLLLVALVVLRGVFSG
jgi:Domain of unknown function (DUF1707)/Domain of unknown function (DUF4190)